MRNVVFDIAQMTGSGSEERNFYWHIHSGFGNILVGIVFLLISPVNLLIKSDTLAASITVVLTLSWIFGKEILRRKYYGKSGKSTESLVMPKLFWLPGYRLSYIVSVVNWLTLLLSRYGRMVAAVLAALIAACFVIVDILDKTISQPETLAPLILILATPIIIWQYLRTPFEAFAGYTLLRACVGAFEGWLKVNLQVDPDSW